VRNTRRLARRLRGSILGPGVTLYQHGLYATIAPRTPLRIRDVKRAVTALCTALSDEGLPAQHAGSFGFDFAAIEWFRDPVSRRNVMRIAPGDLPAAMIDRLADGIVEWFSMQTKGAQP
jgi:hypothetical protein